MKSAPSRPDEVDWLAPVGFAAGILLFAVKFVGSQAWKLENDRTVQIGQMILALSAFGIIAWGIWLHRKGTPLHRQTLRDRMLVVIGLCSFAAYFNFGHLHFHNFVHVWDTYHYHMGAKYFPELNYERLYDCSEVVGLESGRKAEVSKRTLTDLRTNLIVKTDDLVAYPEEKCKRYFTPERWETFKSDINTYRSWVNEERWNDILHDHGYNATPVWTVMGMFWTNALARFERYLVPNIPGFTDPKTGKVYPSVDEAELAAQVGDGHKLGLYNEGLRARNFDPPWTSYLGGRHVILLNLIDPIFWVLTALVIWWGFGPRAFAIAAIVMGCNFPNRFYWTGGAFLRHDWIFFLVASICLLKKDKPVLGGAAFAYTTLLRLFPGLVALGPALAAIDYWRRHRTLDRGFVKYVASGAITTIALIGVSAIFVNNRTASTLHAEVKKSDDGALLHLSRVDSRTDAPVTWIKGPVISSDDKIDGLTFDSKDSDLTVTGSVKALPADKPAEVSFKIHGGDTHVIPIAVGDSAESIASALVSKIHARSAEDRATGALAVWQRFANNTIKHANTPLTNHMGLRTLLSWRPSTVGRYTAESGQIDNWLKWKNLRLDKWHEAKPLFVLAMLFALVMVYLAIHHTGTNLWIASALGIGFIPFGAELTNYYYCFFMGMALLYVIKREVGLVMCAMCAAALFIEWHPIQGMSGWLDEQYVAMSVAALVACVVVWWSFTLWGARKCLPPEPEADWRSLTPLAIFAGAPADTNGSAPATAGGPSLDASAGIDNAATDDATKKSGRKNR